MKDEKDLTDCFEAHRPRLRRLAYRMLGSFAEAEDAVQETWLRISQTRSQDVENFGGWVTTVASRVCLNALRGRGRRREDAYAQLPDPAVELASAQPEERLAQEDAIGFALMVVLDRLSPAERVTFVLHDLFGLRFEEIASALERSTTAVRQLGSRARRRIKLVDTGSAPQDIERQRRVVDAFFRAADAGDFEGLLAVLSPDAVLRVDFGLDHRPKVLQVKGAGAIAQRARLAPRASILRATVNNGAGAVLTIDNQRYAVMAFTVVADKIVEINTIADAKRLARLAAEHAARGDDHQAIALRSPAPESDEEGP
jgi:RNA polymerase sigma factor (sigma-70 family)